MEDSLRKVITIEWAKVGTLDNCFIRFIDAWVMKGLRGAQVNCDIVIMIYHPQCQILLGCISPSTTNDTETNKKVCK